MPPPPPPTTSAARPEKSIVTLTGADANRSVRYRAESVSELRDLPSSADVVVVGAGLAGLAAARELRRRNRDVVVLEASDGVGGRVRTDDVDGFQLDRGFQILLTGYPEAKRQLDLAGLDLRRFDPGALVLLDGKRLRMGDPLRAPSSLPATALSPVGSIADKLRVLKLRTTVGRADPRPLFGGADVTTAEHLRSLGFSDGFVRRFLGPLFAGIQLDPELRTSRKMFDLIFRSLATGDAAVPARGMRAIPEQLAAGLPAGTVHLGRRVLAVDGGSVTVEGGATVTARAVVVATEGPAAAALTGIPEPGSRSAGCVWFDAPRSPFDRRLIGLDGTNAGPVRNLAVMSDIAPEYAPPGRALVAAACPADIADDLEPRVRTQLRGWFGAEVDTWRTLRVDRIPHGQPDQSPPFALRKRVHLHDGLWVCGDHRDTGSIQGALFSGRRTATAVDQALA